MAGQEQENADRMLSISKGFAAGVGLCLVAFDSGRIIRNVRDSFIDEKRGFPFKPLRSDLLSARSHVAALHESVDYFGSSGLINDLPEVNPDLLARDYGLLRQSDRRKAIRESIAWVSIGAIMLAPAVYDGIKGLANWVTSANSERE